MSYLQHALRISHQRRDIALTYGNDPAESTVDIDATGSDLTTVWAEALSRMPNDLYKALKVAMGVEE